MPQLDRRRSNPDPANVIASHVRLLRQIRALTQAELAKEVQAEVIRIYPDLSYGLDQSDVSRIESGKRPVWDYELKAIAVVFGVSSDYLLGLVDEQGRILGDEEDPEV